MKKSDWEHYFPMPNTRNYERLEYVVSRMPEKMIPEKKVIYDILISMLDQEQLSLLIDISIRKLIVTQYLVCLGFSTSTDTLWNDYCSIKIAKHYVAFNRFKGGLILESKSCDIAHSIDLRSDLLPLVELAKSTILKYIRNEE